MKISMTILKVQSRQDYETNNFKGALFCKKIASFMLLVLYTLSDAALYLYQVS